jgi:phosphoglycerate dehydrogenase-like enzyme
MEVHDHRHPLFTRAHAEAVADSVPEIDFVIVPRESVLPAIGTADAFVGPPTPELIGAASSRLRWVQTQGGGIEDALFPSLRDSPIVLTSAKIIKGPAMGDHAMALLLGLTREIWRGVESRRTEVWSNRHWKPVELHGKTALIVGLGGAGTQIAERAFASGMRVMAVDPKDIPMMRAVERLERVEALPDLLPLADVVFIAAPLTDRSVGMFDDRIFGLMKRGAYLINVSRGALVNTDALVRALRNGRLAGAGLDVIVPEPLPRGHPLWKMTNVILTPHLAGTSDIGATRRTQLVIENARRFARGLPLRNAVDKKLGY